MGGVQVLLSFPNLEDALSRIQAFSFDFKEMFSGLDKWVPSQPRSSRVIWVRCYGVPLSVWSRETFEEIGRKMGKVIAVTKETEEKEMLEFGRLQLQVENFLEINTVIYLRSFGYLYPISVREETAI